MKIVTGRKTITTAGTEERLVSSALAAYAVVIQAETDNTGKIAVGDASINAVAPNERGAILTAGQAVSLTPNFDGDRIDLTTIFVDCSVNGDGVTFTYVI